MKRFIWAVLIVGFVLFSLSPTFYELSQKEKLQGRSFELVHNYITDYNFYVSRVRQGMEGRWTVTERYTSEPYSGSLIQIFYLLLGKIDNHAPTILMGTTGVYHVSRVILGLVILSLVAYLSRTLFSSFLWEVIAFLVVVTASVWPHVVPVGDTVRFGGPMSWWTLMDNLQRITFLPHLLMGQSLLLFLFIAGGSVETLKRSGNTIVLGICAFVLGMVFPPGLVFVGVGYGVMMLMSFFHYPSIFKKNLIPVWLHTHVLPRTLIGLISIPSFLYFFLIFTVYPGKRLVELDILHPLPFQFPEYVRALGPTLPLGILGLILVFFLKDRKFMGVVSWVIAWLVCLFVFQYIPQQSPLRFSEMLPHVPLGILTTYVFYMIWRVCSRVSSLSVVKTDNNSRVLSRVFSQEYPQGDPFLGAPQPASPAFIFIGKIFSLTVPMLIIVVGLGVMVSSFLWQKDFIDQKVAAGWPPIAMNNIIVYPVTGFVDGLIYIEKNTPLDAIILSDMTAGNYIPSYTGRKVFVGHHNTVFLEKKLQYIELFFQGNMVNASQWLSDSGIGYVFWGPQEKQHGTVHDLKTVYPFLRELYKNADVTFYAVK